MDLIFGLAMVLGIGPALILMYLGVRNYTYPRVEQPFFSDPTFFLLLVVGMIAGSVLFFALVALGFANNVVYMVILAIIEVLFMVVCMNLKRFRGKSDSVFYGYSLGLGTSCGLSTGLVFITASTIANSDVGFDASVIVLVLISVAMSLILGACGTTVGEGIARHRVMEFALQAMIPMVVFNILLWVVLRGVDVSGEILYYVCAVAMMVFAAAVYYRTMLVRLPQIIREVLKMEGKKRNDLPR